MDTHRYSVVKAAVVKALREGNVQHETRAGEPEATNLLQVGEVDASFVAGAILGCPASRATRSDHHQRPGVNVWALRPIASGVTWYIKFYFDEVSEAWFISVHPSRSDAPSRQIGRRQP